MSDEHTFLFADLEGYTAMTEAHGDEPAAELAGRFCDSVTEILPDYGAEAVKTLGDALMIRAADPSGALRLGVRLVGDYGARHGFPHVRVGMHTGPAVARGDDWYGTTVNVAARVADAARGGEVLLSGATRDAIAREHPEVEVRPVGRRRLKNVREPVELFAAVAGEGERVLGFPRDPVCHMGVDPARSAFQEVYRDAVYHFCSAACRDAFVANPGLYVRGRSARGELRVSDHAREHAVRRLRRAYGRGRLSAEELEERAERAYAARTRADLAAVQRDLPRRRGGFGLLRWLLRLFRRRRRRR